MQAGRCKLLKRFSFYLKLIPCMILISKSKLRSYISFQVLSVWHGLVGVSGHQVIDYQ
jgi:hypothetical protein